MPVAAATFVPMQFVPAVVTTGAQFLWMPLSAVLVPMFVGGSTGSFFFSFAIVPVWMFLKWVLAMAVLDICDDTTGEPAYTIGLQNSDAPYCTGHFPFDYPHGSVVNDASGFTEDRLYELSPAASSMAQFWVPQLVVIFVAIMVGVFNSYVRARLVHNQRKLMFHIPTAHEAKAMKRGGKKKKDKKANSDDPSESTEYSYETDDETTKMMQGAGAVQELGYPDAVDNANINRLEALDQYAEFNKHLPAPWFDLTLGVGGTGAIRAMLLCCSPGGYHREQQGMGIEISPENSDRRSRDPVLDHMNYLWVFSWAFVITTLELLFEMLPMIYNRYSNESHNAVWIWRAILGSFGFGILLTAFFLYMWAFIVYPLSTKSRRGDLKDGHQHAGAYENLNAEWFTNYLTIVFPVIVHLCLMSWVLTPALGSGVLDDINYSTTIDQYRERLADARLLEFLIPLGSLLVIFCWSVALWFFKGGLDTKNMEFYKLAAEFSPNVKLARHAKK
jgi:hypothetical protein